MILLCPHKQIVIRFHIDFSSERFFYTCYSTLIISLTAYYIGNDSFFFLGFVTLFALNKGSIIICLEKIF